MAIVRVYSNELLLLKPDFFLYTYDIDSCILLGYKLSISLSSLNCKRQIMDLKIQITIGAILCQPAHSLPMP